MASENTEQAKRPAKKTPADTAMADTSQAEAAPSGVDEHGWEPTDYHKQAAEHGCAGDIPDHG